MVVELGRVKGGDVEGEDDDGGIAAGGAEAAELLDVGDVVAAAAGGDASALAQAFEFGETFDEGEGEEEEDAEAAEPGGGADSGGGRASNDANGVKAGEDNDIHQDGAFETQGVSESCDEIDAQPEEKMARLDEGELR